MDKNTIFITPFIKEKEKWLMWSEKFMARSGIKGFDVLLTGDKKIPSDDSEKTKVKGFSELK